MIIRTLAVPAGYRLDVSLGGLPFGRHDPCARWVAGTFWWAARTPAGPGTLALRQDAGAVAATAYGPGAPWLRERADAVAGLRDDVTGFADVAAGHPLVRGLARRYAALRLPATGLVFPRLLRAVLEQKVTGKEAYLAYAATVRHFGAPAPGPQPLLLPPDPAAVAAEPYWTFHRFGVEQRRATTLLRAAALADRLQSAGPADAARRLRAVPGIGPWTVAEVRHTVYGDADAVSVGDYHLKNIVAYALAGEPRATDDRMLELLAPFAGHRGRVCALLLRAGHGAPRWGPRQPVRSFARF
ncbi:3-methyladenine DNA glycosylase [Pilimelia terevasa]|uniref:3-methyladenine DNA glycosylase n=1 Tax=Pilimelia terevasa TaxID=53372 RepID=A0A8J3BUT1_9ACTN|nr:DNA-3-methyladenine glycosylase 2 family protein [Pilimelia terevasa]GGK39406.1 3-methyladenine DNA glycosylase [Pilimelia terevasa]